MESFKQTTPDDLLGDLQDGTVQEPATKSQRFGNFIIDYVIAMAVLMAIAFMLGLQQIVLAEYEYQLIFVLLYVGYCFIMEAFANGRTIGKMITKTRVVRYDGQPLSPLTVLGRSFSRIVPFEAFSGLGDAPWHDKWTNTEVIKDKK
ncbi:RDD family protein [Chitinophaga niastensis]|uniref:RDD family protein n=1 Tax=Chitinophaga niastensis TaxID=536980 RepID=A0A2P8HMM0_CHINA|nr:RDD family protein [Chitinophaga niastensis]PSL47459.1 RDD family protein [Chitinophaga niastensis]